MGRKIIVTGYGPFLSSAEDRTPIKHDINASWEVAKALKANWAESTDLSIREIEVSYEGVDRAVEEIWASEPIFVIHMGVAGSRKEICLETKAKNGPYNKKDVLGKIRQPEFVDGPEDLFSTFDCDLCRTECCKDYVRLSDDAGLYLCEYIYYKSLQKSKNVLFIHVPLISTISAEEAAVSVKTVIKTILKSHRED